MHQLAPSSSAFGQLQRGRGAGWLYVASAAKGKDMLLSCLEHEPRWDAQVERRGWYYATLAKTLGVTADRLATAKLDNTYGLGQSVLFELAKLGDATATDALRAVLVPGPHPDSVLRDLAELPAGLDGIETLIAERFAAEDLFKLILWSDQLPWRKWAKREPRLKAAVADVAAYADKQNETQTPLKSFEPDASLKDILKQSQPWTRFPDPLVERFVKSPSSSELRRMRAAAIGLWNGGRRFSLSILARRGDPCALDLAESRFVANVRGIERTSLYQYIRALDAKHTLPLARRWLDASDSRAGIAATLMSLHGEAADVPVIRAALRTAWDEHDVYMLCSLITALGRHPGQGPYPELHMIFADVSYSYARNRAVLAMAKVDPDFGRLFAREALWDCEDETRAAGVSMANRSDGDVLARIEELAVLGNSNT
jgi:hypothetical protein